MRQVLALAAVTAAALMLVASPADASSSSGPSLKSLAAQVKSLQTQVKKLKKQVATDESFLGLTLTYSVCSTAVAADAIQDTYTGLDAQFASHAWPAYFGAQSPVNDYQACSDLRIVRAHNQSPPNTNVLRALLDLFKPTAFARATGLDWAALLNR
jgi:hypothetical protein